MPIDRNQNRNALFGAAIVAGFILIGFIIFFIGDVLRAFQPHIEIVAVVDYAGGLGENSPVWIAGKEVGMVTSVDMRDVRTDSTQRVAVTMKIPAEYAHYVRRDSRARITTARIVGSPVVDILPGSPSAPAIADGDTLHIRPSGSLMDVMDRAIAVSSAFDTMFQEMRLLEAPAVRRTDQLARINAHLATVTTEFRSLMLALQEGPLQSLSDPQMRAIIDRLGTRTRQLSEAFGRAAQRARAARSDAQPEIESLMARADTIAREIARVQAVMESGGGGLLMRAQQDSAIMKAIHGAQVQLDSLMAETKRNPLRFWF